MNTRTIVAFIIINFFIFVEGDSQRYNVSNSDNFSYIELRKENLKSQRSKLGLDGTSSASQMKNIVLRPDEKSKSVMETDVEQDFIDEGNRKIMKFANRILDSIKKYGIRGKAENLLKSGKYRIDWWKQDRRLERIRKRLSEELERNPELKYRLRSLGWRNSSATIVYQKKILSDQSMKKKPTNNEKTDLKETVLYKTLITAFKSLIENESSRDSESGQKGPTIFVYMPITITSSTNEMNKIKEAAMTEFSEPDSPTKFNLNALENTDFGRIVSDFGVVDVTSNGMSMAEETALPSYSGGGQTVDTDRLLQLIPLVVEELRGGSIPEDERRALNWIFGRRLWQLIEREASKRPNETMDQDMAMFLLKGELVERDLNNDLRNRRQRRNALDQRKRQISRSIEIPKSKESQNSNDYYQRDYHFEYIGDYKNDNNDANNEFERSDDLSLRNFDRQLNFHSYVQFARKQKSKKLAMIISDSVDDKNYDHYDSINY